MSLSRFPLPSIHHVLGAEQHETLSRRPSVITVLEHDQSSMSAATTSTSPIASIGHTPSTSHLMKTIDLRDAEPIAKDDEEQFSFIVHFADDEELEGDTDADARTIFKQKRPPTSRGLGSSSAKDSAKHNFSLLIINTVRKVLPVKLAEALLRKMNRH